MEIRNWTQTIQRNGCTGVIFGVKQPEQGGKPSASGSSSDTVEISEAGRQAAMAYRQLKGLRFGGVTLSDSYALGSEGIKRLASVEDRAKETAQAAYDAAPKDVDARQETINTQRKEQFKQAIARINSGTGTCMSYMALRPNTSGA